MDLISNTYKKIFKKSIITALLSLSFALSFALPTYALDVYTFDSGHTYVLWHVSHFGFSDLTGKFFASGTLAIDRENPRNSQVNVTIDTADLSTGIPKLDNILKGSSFFDVSEYPTATFTSRSVSITGKDSAKVLGILTLRGISRPVLLNVQLNKIGVHPFYKKKAVGFKALTELKRSEFNIKSYLPGVGDIVELEIQAEAEIHTSY